jgi:uncharacterized repeat protein (TIGR01451 family)
MSRTGPALLPRGLVFSFSFLFFLIISLLFVVIASTSCRAQFVAATQSVSPVDSNPGTSPHLSVTPANASVTAGDTLQFTALVTNTGNTAVKWSTSAGKISDAGLLSAPGTASPQTVSVTATSAVAGSAAVKVTINPAHALRITSTVLPAGMSGASYNVKLTATGGTSPYEWTLASGSLPSGLRLNSSGVITGAPSRSGRFPVSVTLKDSATHTTSQALSLLVAPVSQSGFDGPAQLPHVYLYTTLGDTPAPGKTIPVNAGGDFQAALDNADCGDTITLQAGATYGGVFYFPQKPCDTGHWIIVRTSAPDSALPPEQSRITPCYAGVALLPGRPSFNCSSTKNVMAKLSFVYKSGFGPVVFNSGANHYRLIGLEITRAANHAFISDLISPDNGATATEIVLDRLWVHGTAQDETTRGVYLNGMTSTAVIDSYFTDFHCVAITGSCTDSQAIGGGGGTYASGPYKIADNFLEAAGENILFGGGPATITPADIVIQQNHIFKPLIWMPGQPGFVGGHDGHPFIVKNNFELKNAQRVLFEGNIVEYTWGGFSQEGYSIGLTPKNQAGSDGANLCPACLVTDVTIRYSTISHAGAGINLANALSDNKGMAAGGGRYSIHDITIDDINGDYYFGGGPLFLVLNGWTTNILGNILINHVTGFGDPIHPSLTVGNDIHNPKMSNFFYTNNLVRAGEYPVWSSGGKTNCAYSGVPVIVLNNCFDPYAYVSNALISSPANYPPSRWPSRNYFPPDPAAVQFVNYNDGNGGNYQLQPTSPYKNAGTDGKDLGADIDAIQAAIANAY